MREPPISVRASVAAYALFLRLLPRRLRERHGAAMRRMARTLFIDAHRERGLPGVVRAGVATIGDLVLFLVTGTGSVLTSPRPSSVPSGPEGTHPLPTHRGALVQTLLHDVVIAARSLRKRPLLLLVGSFTLALGIGATTAVFSLVWGAWLKPLPYPDADRLVRIGDVHERFEPGLYSTVSIGNYVDMKEGSRTFEATTLFTWSGAEPEGMDRRITLLYSEPNLFETLGVDPSLGRAFATDDPDADERTVILSHGLWQDAFGGGTDVLGRELVMFERPWTVIGVAPDGLEFPREVDAIIPFRWSQEQRNAHGGRSMYAFGRLQPGVSLDAARSDLRAIYAGIAERYPESHEGWTVGLSSFREFVVGRDHTALRLMGWAAGILLLITCANVASLLLARAESRKREVAVRAALGAGRTRIVTSFLAESLILGVLGGVLGLAVALGGIDLLVSIFGGSLRRPSEIGLNVTTGAVALGLVASTTFVVGLVPGLSLNVRRLGEVLRDGSRGRRRGRSSVRKVLVVTQVALAVILVSGAGLLLNTTWRLAGADLGFEPEGAVAAYLELPGDRYAERPEQGRLYRRLMEALRSRPEIAAVGAGDRVPPDGNITNNGYRSVGSAESLDFVVTRQVTPGYFAAAGVDFVAGSEFEWQEPSDSLTTAIPVVVNERLAAALFPEGDAVGRLIANGDRRFQVTGVVESVHQRGADVPAQPALYSPWPAVPLSFQSRPVLLLRGTDATAEAESAALAALRGVLEDIDPDLRLGSRSLEESLAGLYGPQEFAFSLMAVFAGLALALGVVGIYGVISYTVAERAREVGIRMALGAPRRRVVTEVLRQGLALTVAGIVLGLGAAALLGRSLESLLFGVSTVDLPTYAVVGSIFVAAAAVATLVPARRASRVNPTEAFRME